MKIEDVNKIAKGMAENGVTIYLIIFICGMLIFNNYNLMVKINKLLTAIDKVAIQQAGINKDTNERITSVEKKVDYIILKFNRDEAIYGDKFIDSLKKTKN